MVYFKPPKYNNTLFGKNQVFFENFYNFIYLVLKYV